MKIRELQKGDIPALAEVAAKTFTETFGHSFTPEELETELRETRSETYFRSVMDSDTLFVAVMGERLAGYVQLSDVMVNVQGLKPGPSDQAVNAIYIHSDYQGKGIGRALMDAAFEHPRFKKAEHIFVEVWDENKRAVAFYLKYGFEIVGKCDVTVDGKIVGYDLVLMRPAQDPPRSGETAGEGIIRTERAKGAEGAGAEGSCSSSSSSSSTRWRAGRA